MEFLDAACSDLATTHLPGVSNPLEQSGQQGEGEGDNSAAASPFYMLVETHGSDADHDKQKMERFLEVCSC